MLTLCVNTPLWAADTQFTPVIAISETYTDNVRLMPRGFEQSDWVTEVRAGFNFSGTGRRARVNLDYTPSLFTFAGQDEVELRHALSSAGEVELMEDHFFLHGSASIANRFVSADRDISISDRNLSGDRVQVLSYSVSPELRNRFGSAATASLRYRFSVADYEQPEDEEAPLVSDSTVHGVGLNVNSGEDFQRFRWGLSANWSRQDREDNAVDVTDKYFNANASYNLNRTVAFTGNLGYQDYGYSGSSFDRSGVTWEVGARLTPTRRTSLSVGYGRDQNNKHWRVNGSYQPDARTSLTFSYNESYQTFQELDIDDLPSLDDQPAAPGLGGAFDFFDRNDIPGGRPTDEVFLNKRFSVSLSRTISRTNISISASDSDRSYDAGTGEQITTVSALIAHTFSSNVSGRLLGSYIKRDDSTGRMDDIYTASAYLSRELVGSASVFVSYDYTRRDSNFFLFDLRENAVTVGLTASF